MKINLNRKILEKLKTLKGKIVLIPATFALTTSLTFSGCQDNNTTNIVEPNTQIPEIIFEEQSEEINEIVSKEEATIINNVLTLKESQMYIEELKLIYPNMTEEEIIGLFVNFNIHSLDDNAIKYYTTNYECGLIHYTLYDKIITSAETYYVINKDYDGVEYKDSWFLTDFIVNEQAKSMAQELENYLCKMAYTPNANEWINLNNGLYDYMIGENDCFSFDYNSEQKYETDLEGICYFITRYNAIFNTEKMENFIENDITPVARYMNEKSISK